MANDDRYGTFSDAPSNSAADAAEPTPALAPAQRSTGGAHEKRTATAMSDANDVHDPLRPRTASSQSSAQAGVKRLEAIASTWSRTALYIAYLGIGLTAFATSLESQTTINLAVYATSAFSAHSLVSTVLVVQGVVLSVVKPPMSKIADVFGRFEGFTLSVFIYVIGYIQQAAANNVKTYAAAQIFYSAGQTGLQILIQIFIADTSDLLNRAFVATLPDTPFLINVWIGPTLADAILTNLNWRWGYGIWAVVLPVAFLPLALALYLNQRKAAKRGMLPASPLEGKDWWETAKSLWFELDAVGLLLICVGFSLILIPLTVGAESSWKDPSILAMLVVGSVCVIVFPFWERSKTLAPRPCMPRALMKNRTFLSGLAFAFFYFSAFYLSVLPYFQSYLLVVHGLSVAEAGRIIQTFTFVATITALLVSLVIKYTGRYRIMVTVGSCIYVSGLILMLVFRTEHSRISAIVGAQVLIGIGGGMCHFPAQLGVQASASHSEVGAATAAFLTLLEIGGAVGSAISGSIWSSNILPKLQAYLPPETKDRATDIFGSIDLAANGWPMGSPTRDAINLAYQETITRIVFIAVCMATPCILLSFLMENYKLDEMDQHVKGTVIGKARQASRDFEAGPSSGQCVNLLHHDDGHVDGDDDEDDNDDSNLDAKMQPLLRKQGKAV
ncbi:hypothetical protein BAUCODRAFT_31368 [Baudoinia panamericana UAMH 10762]|uniref:Major facilitator superfamily (MFS) profile domain-containing protein n=1 Tax=Baudoinia panamericana (strain UAMH 10762) TaxID=717646 RepID=M2MQK8_BAUPA|nr:uncharacterized protein BAUCODRAFT_31368 [Baudoinia panamericana UAMH 10762]EMC99081.1 hypothetical protein BAUCODRAFT_31368 [Baudoinia panamericana UAMH 10762]